MDRRGFPWAPLKTQQISHPVFPCGQIWSKSAVDVLSVPCVPYCVGVIVYFVNLKPSLRRWRGRGPSGACIDGRRRGGDRSLREIPRGLSVTLFM